MIKGFLRHVQNSARLAGIAAAGFVSATARDKAGAIASGRSTPERTWTPKVPSISLRDALRSERAILPVENAMDGNVSPLELIALAGFAAESGVKNIFEIGTFNGFTSLTFAVNSAPDARVFTLDLPPEGNRSTQLNVAGGDQKYIAQTTKGGYFRQGRRAEESKVTQLYGDSATFDYGPYIGSMDLVFVDGSHSYDYVKSDTDRALKLLRNGRGTVLWHDYNTWWPGVIQFLEESLGTSALAGVRRIEGTSLAMLRK